MTTSSDRRLPTTHLPEARFTDADRAGIEATTTSLRRMLSSAVLDLRQPPLVEAEYRTFARLTHLREVLAATGAGLDAATRTADRIDIVSRLTHGPRTSLGRLSEQVPHLTLQQLLDHARIDRLTAEQIADRYGKHLADVTAVLTSVPIRALLLSARHSAEPPR